MKVIVRTSAVVMLVTGLGLSAHSRQAAATHQIFASHQVFTSYMPAPACPPDDPDGCGIGSK